jgi:glycerol-3-phosphate dehydrogenase (NAD(P)+)
MITSTVMGSGSWGTAFAMILADAGGKVAVWGINPEVTEAINAGHGNPVYHPGIPLPATVRATTDAAEGLTDASIVVLAVPAQVLRANLQRWGSQIPGEAVVVSLMKGIELGSTLRMSEVIAECTGVAPERIAVVSGPNLAREIVQRQPAATVIACSDPTNAEFVQRATITAYFRPYTSADVAGAEIGGSVKNVIALASGMAAGLGFGENSQAALITRGLAEMTRLGVALGADERTFSGLAGVGDLIATCSSPLSRNRTFGENLGKGMTLDEVEAVTSQTSEGVKSCQPILDLANRLGVDMPITAEVVQVVHHGLTPRQAVANLMSRSAKAE